MTQSVQPRYRNIPLTALQLATRPLWGRRVISALTIGAKQRASGGDYSHWNGNTGFHPQNGEPGLSDFAIGKVTEGTGYIDPSFAVNWPGYEWHPVRGAYHYARSQWSGRAQAAHFLRQLTPYVAAINFLGWDFESVGNTFTTGFMVETFNAMEFIRAEHPARLYLYTNRSLRNWLRTESLKYYGEDVFLQYGFWYAAPLYTPSPDANPIMPTDVPRWDFYQWTWAFDGRRVGINDATIDYNVYNGDRAKLLADLDLGTPPPEPPPPGDDMNVEKIRTELDKIAAARDVIILAESTIRAELDDSAPSPFTEQYTCTADNLFIRQTPGGVATGAYLRKNETCLIDPSKTGALNGVPWYYHDGGPSGQVGFSSSKYLKKS